MSMTIIFTKPDCPSCDGTGEWISPFPRLMLDPSECHFCDGSGLDPDYTDALDNDEPPRDPEEES